jgi:hypothetical protein
MVAPGAPHGMLADAIPLRQVLRIMQISEAHVTTIALTFATAVGIDR